MEMKVNSRLIKIEREKRAWSQEQLAMIAGLGLRTVQRIETTGSASYESLKAIASAYDMAASDFSVESEQISSAPTSPPTVSPETEVGESEQKLVTDKTSSEWKSRPVWVRAIFLGSSLVRMDRRQLKTLEMVEVITATVLAALGVFALFSSRVAAMPFLFFSMAFLTLAYLASFNVRIGDRFSVWPWLKSSSRWSPRSLAFDAVLLLVLTFPLWAQSIF